MALFTCITASASTLYTLAVANDGFDSPFVVTDTETGTSLAKAQVNGLTGSGTVTASASYGAVSVNGTGDGDVFTYIFGKASFADSMTIYGGQGTGTLRWSIFGAQSCVTLQQVCEKNDGIYNLRLLTQSSYQFQYGVPFTFGLEMYAQDHNGFLHLDYGIGVTNWSVDNAPSALTYVTESNQPYAFPGASFVPTPEPSTLLLSGMMLVIWLRRSSSLGRT